MISLSAALIGVASVIDADTLDMHGQRIRLHGVDAPESGQVCQLASRPRRCGTTAANALDAYIAGRPVTCEETDRDRYKRIVARCYVDGVELNAWLVRQGHALAYRRYGGAIYDSDEAEAKARRRGVWASEFVPPWEWRRRKQGR